MKNLFLFLLFVLVPGAIMGADRNAGLDRIWIDVRSAAEYETGHLSGAHNINFDRIATHIAEITTDKNALLVLYCKSGRRSGLAKQTLDQLGYVNVVNGGGINDVLRQAKQQAVIGPLP